ncbi:MAG: hypothetical protein P4N59_16150 [Negativicutes bacterium]|nr:hypothetical protein [Negativicutes bacterium]
MHLPIQGRIGRLGQLVCLLAVSFHGVAAQKNVHSTTFDLRSEGYFDLPDDFQYLQFKLVNGQVAFIDAERVAVSFMISNKNIGLTDRKHLSGGKWLFQTLVINANSGQLQGEWIWRTASPDSKFVSLPTGQFLVSSDERITLQQADGQTRWQLDLPKTDLFPANPYGTAIESNTGNTLFVVSDKDKETQTVDVYRTSDLGAENTFTIPYQSLTNRMAATDNGLLYMGLDRPFSLFIDHFGRSSDRIWICKTPWQCGLSPQFIGTNRLLLNDGLHSLLLLDNQGTLLLRHELGKEEIGRISVSFNGARVMVMLLKMGGGSTFFDVFPKAKAARIAILDADTLREIASLPVDPNHTVRAGINPTGDLVAYIDNGMLKFWNVSASTKAK